LPRVGGIVFLAPLYKRRDRLWRDQFHIVSETGQRAGPVMTRAARLKDDYAGILLPKERDKLAPSKLASDHCLSGLVNGMKLEDGLCGIQTDHGNGHRGWLPFCRFTTRILAHRCRRGRPPQLLDFRTLV
jgi:hypothetical protein